MSIQSVYFNLCIVTYNSLGRNSFALFNGKINLNSIDIRKENNFELNRTVISAYIHKYINYIIADTPSTTSKSSEEDKWVLILILIL